MKRHAVVSINKSKDNLNIKKESSMIVEEIIKDLDSQNNKDDIFNWRTIDNTVLCKAYNNFKPGKKLLSFDLDDTLIEYKKEKKKKQGTDENKSIQFSFNIDKIKASLEKFCKDDFVLAVFSNQNGIITGQIKEIDLKSKIDKLFNELLKYPFVFIGAKEKDYYRKPSPGMLEIFKTKFNLNEEINLNESIFVGDAAGRKKSKTYPRNDFSDSDYKFALNCGMKFMTPEELFLGKNADYPKITDSMHKYDKNNNEQIKYDLSPGFKEVILLVGSPGSGKSTFSENYLIPKGYVRINQDTLKTKEKVKKCLIENMKENKKIVIDSTNPTKEARSLFIKTCNEFSYPIRAFVFQVSKELAFHLNNLRRINTVRKHYSGSVDNIPIHAFYKNYQEPTMSEGFNEIVKVNFVPGPFLNEKDKNIFYFLS